MMQGCRGRTAGVAGVDMFLLARTVQDVVASSAAKNADSGTGYRVNVHKIYNSARTNL